MSKASDVLWGAVLMAGVTFAPSAWGQSPQRGPGEEEKQPKAGQQNDNAAREGERRTDEARDRAADRDANRNARDRETPDTRQPREADRTPARDRTNREATDRDRDTNRDRTGDRDADRDRTDRDRTRDQDADRDRTDRDPNRDRNADRDRSDRDRPDFGASIDRQNDRLHVSNVTGDSIAARAGLRQGDVVLSVNGQRVTDRAMFDRYLYRSRVARVPIIVLRGNDRHTIYVESNLFVRDGRRIDDRRVAGGAWLGVTMDSNQPDRAILIAVQQDSPADRAGLRRGDTILRLNDSDVRGPDHLQDLIGQHQSGDRVELTLGGQSSETVSVTLGDRPRVTRVYDREVAPAGIDVDVTPRGAVDVDTGRERRLERRGRR